MAVYKEAMSWISQIGTQQQRIWEDAADYGVPVIDQKTSEAVQLVKNLVELYSVDSRDVTHHNSGVTIELKFTFLEEFGDGSEVPCTIFYEKFRRPRSCSATDQEIIGYIQIYCPKWLPPNKSDLLNHAF